MANIQGGGVLIMAVCDCKLTHLLAIICFVVVMSVSSPNVIHLVQDDADDLFSAKPAGIGVLPAPVTKKPTRPVSSDTVDRVSEPAAVKPSGVSQLKVRQSKSQERERERRRQNSSFGLTICLLTSHHVLMMSTVVLFEHCYRLLMVVAVKR